MTADSGSMNALIQVSYSGTGSMFAIDGATADPQMLLALDGDTWLVNYGIGRGGFSLQLVPCNEWVPY